MFSTPQSFAIVSILSSVLALALVEPCCAQGESGPKLTAAERLVVGQIERKLATKFNSKDNPGDRDTWYVLMFRDVAASKTKSFSGNSSTGSVVTFSRGTSKQEKKQEDAIVVQGRTMAAVAIARYLSSPNAAAAELKPPRAGSGSGVVMQRDTQVAADRQWDFRAFDNEADAKAFRESVKPKAKKK